MTLFIRALSEEDKAAALTAAVAARKAGQAEARLFDVNPESFEQVPGSPFAYWVSDTIRGMFTRFPAFESESRTAKQGLATADDFRFVRTAWEVPPKQIGTTWRPFAKGGAYSPFYADLYLVVNWRDDGAEIKNNLNERGGVRSNVWMLRDTAAHFFGRPGLTWPLRGIRFSAQMVPSRCVFSVAGKMAFAKEEDLSWLGALFNSLSFDRLIALFAGKVGGVQYEVGLISALPVPKPTWAQQNGLQKLARDGWSLKRTLDTAELKSHAFILPALLQAMGTKTGNKLKARAEAWERRVADTKVCLQQIQAKIDEVCFDLYGFSPEDREAVCAPITKSDTAPADEDEDASASRDTQGLASELADWLIGAAFGRFDVRLATGERPLPGEPKPFDPLPVSSPGMLTDGRGLPAEKAPEDYALEFPVNGILVDDPGLDGDLPADWDMARRARDVLSVVFGEGASDIEAELCQLLGVRDLRSYLRRPAAFFADHLARYSKSKRKAPIYWPLSTASGSYTLWIYYPRLTADTLFHAVSEHVSPKISEVEQRITELEAEQRSAEGRVATRITKQLGELTELRHELIELRDELLRITALPYKPNLNDGVQITAAPLWRLFLLPKWQKLLKDTWKDLEKGKYDWAHLALAIWPERVRETCKHDKSIAIAHDLEALFEDKAEA